MGEGGAAVLSVILYLFDCIECRCPVFYSLHRSVHRLPMHTPRAIPCPRRRVRGAIWRWRVLFFFVFGLGWETGTGPAGVLR